MKRWKISEAKARFTEVLSACEKFPQIICRRDKAIGVLIPVVLFEELMALKKRHEKPSMAEMLAELEGIRKESLADIQIPPRENRPDAVGAITDEMAV